MTAREIPEYRYAAPSQDDALDMLGRVLGPALAAQEWRDACREAGLRLPTGDLDPHAVLRVAERLARRPGVAGVLGTSLAIRARTYVNLHAARSA